MENPHLISVMISSLFKYIFQSSIKVTGCTVCVCVLSEGSLTAELIWFFFRVKLFVFLENGEYTITLQREKALRKNIGPTHKKKYFCTFSI